jgi:MerR family transcriptional regulator/heat shock protein HspR
MQQTPGVYLISVVAETLNMHPQTLRKYERAGFVEPLRMGSLRTYSDDDIARLRLIKHFVGDMGLNLSGVELALHFASELLQLRVQLSSDEAGGPSGGSIQQVDGMLATLGIRVVRRPRTEDNPAPPRPGEAGFKVNPGEAVEFR